jgi:Mg/Co/Ni transporter MgtE
LARGASAANRAVTALGVPCGATEALMFSDRKRIEHRKNAAASAMPDLSTHLNSPVIGYARADFPLLRRDMAIHEALQVIREKGVGERIVYFYVTDENERLVGVLPTRRLLTAQPEAPVGEIMIPRVVPFRRRRRCSMRARCLCCTSSSRSR